MIYIISYSYHMNITFHSLSTPHPQIVLAAPHHRPGSVQAVSRHHLGSVSASFWQCPTTGIVLAAPRIVLAVSRLRPGSVPPVSLHRHGSVPASLWQRPSPPDLQLQARLW